MPSLVQGTIAFHKRIGPEVYLLKVIAPSVTAEAVPGQFVHVRCSLGADPLLRRPFSLHRLERHTGSFSLLYEVRGKGTALLARKKEGESLDVMGPLGRGFTIRKQPGTVIAVGGGLGTAPLLALVEEYSLRKDFRCRVLLGASSERLILRRDVFTRTGADLQTATDDGSLGYRGPVTELLPAALEGPGPFYVYACGPQVMLRKVAEFCIKEGITGEVSLDHRMACGTGACMGCSCLVKGKGAQGKGDGNQTYARTCKEGPVFDVGEVLWDAE